MTAETNVSPVGVVTALRRVSLDGPDEFWAMSVGLFDAIIRTFYRVYELTDDRACVLRVGLSPACAPVSLSDGTRIETSELVGTLHFRNEHLPRHGPADPISPGPAWRATGADIRFMYWPSMSRASPHGGRYGR